jgi:hypothetical protein
MSLLSEHIKKTPLNNHAGTSLYFHAKKESEEIKVALFEIKKRIKITEIQLDYTMK